MSDKDKEILFLRRKMNCIMTAYKIQSWKCNQEREELRHNMSKKNIIQTVLFCINMFLV